MYTEKPSRHFRIEGSCGEGGWYTVLMSFIEGTQGERLVSAHAELGEPFPFNMNTPKGEVIIKAATAVEMSDEGIKGVPLSSIQPS